MNYTKLLPYLLILTLLFNACGSNSENKDNTVDIFNKAEKQFVHNLFLTEYLWADQVTSNIDYASISSPNALIDTLRINPPDIWSFSMNENQYEDFINQKTKGFGFGYTPEFIVFLVRIGSPAYGKLHRGDKIIGINNKLASSDTLHSVGQKLGTPTTFTVLRGSSEVKVTITPREYSFKVTQGKVIQHNNQHVGYLRYDSFTSTSVGEFEKSFTAFKNANISELVIDLRYNGGGSVSVASTLLDNISNAQPGSRQGYLDWNDNHKNKNENFYFSDDVESNDLNMKRVIFLVTNSSASASELVISALKPYLGDSNVVTIGSATHGKNVGMSGKSYGSNYYFLINFFVRNNADETTSFSGIPVTCHAEDDLTRSFGDPQETMLATALYYVKNNHCP